MKNNKDLKSKSTIKRVFYQLLKNKDYSDITVTEVCNIANINRTTFYNDYENLYDVLTDLEISFLLRMKDSIQDLSYIKTTNTRKKKNLIDLIYFFETNQKEYLIYLNTDKFITTNLCVHMKKIILGDEFNKIDEYHFIKEFSSTLVMISTWLLDSEPISVEELAEILI